jgi:DNA-binding beta-propeller fold protein YncE
MAVDLKGRRLFIAALGNNTIEVVDLRSGRRTHSIVGMSEPQDVSYLPDWGRIIVSNGGDGSLRLLDSHTLNSVGSINFREDADNLRYDPESKLLYVGYGRGALGVVDVSTGRITGDIKLPGHPEAFALESRGRRIFVNIPSAGQVAVVDRAKGAIIASWPLRASGNFPIALDERRQRLFIGCRRPATMLIFDIESGREVARVNIGSDVDDISYDPVRGQIYASCGAGFIVLIHQIDADHYKVTARIKTEPGARTSRFEPERMQFFLAVPSKPGRRAEILIYELTTK